MKYIKSDKQRYSIFLGLAAYLWAIHIYINGYHIKSGFLKTPFEFIHSYLGDVGLILVILIVGSYFIYKGIKD